MAITGVHSSQKIKTMFFYFFESTRNKLAVSCRNTKISLYIRTFSGEVGKCLTNQKNMNNDPS